VHRAITHRLGALRPMLRRLTPRLRVSEKKVSATYKLLRFLRAIELPPAEAHFSWNGAWMPRDAAALLSSHVARDLAEHALTDLAARHAMSARPGLGELQEVDATEYLPNDILVKVDRMTMAHSLESRAPLLNHHLAAFALAATPRFEQTIAHPPKRLLRRVADEVLGPRVSRAKKQGFSIPVHAWLRGPARGIVSDMLSPDSLRRIPELNPTAVARVRDRLLVDAEPLGFEVWGLCVLVAWHRARISGGMVSSAASRRDGGKLTEVRIEERS
jgi:asparagine synthase (glutamine-hydrolysing)